ncbi:MAG: hypothetical protein IKT32_02775 [Clostridia bacterium]|nr:hypothetical protein [Clostridia bacterium]
MEKKINNNTSSQKISEEKKQIEILKKKKAKAETSKFKSKYFEYYDDIKISDRQDW